MIDQFSLPPGPARLQRPVSPFRFRFRHFADYLTLRRSGEVPADAAVIPVETVQAGDSQVLAAREPSNPKSPAINLDILADIPSVESVIVSAPILVTRDLPQVRELLFSSAAFLPDPVTLAHFTGLQSLYGARTFASGRLDLDVLPAEQMRELAVGHWFCKSLTPLEKMTGLVDLRADLFRESLEGVAGMTNLRVLQLKGPAKGWAKLRECTRLEAAHLIEVQIANLRRWNTWKELRELVLSGRGVKSLAGLENCEALEFLTLLNLDMSDLSSLRPLQSLRSLTLRMVAKSADLESVAAAPRLRALTIEHSAVEDFLELPTINPLAGAVNIEELTLRFASISDGGLLPLARIATLKKVSFGPEILPDSVEVLHRARPDLLIHYKPPDLARRARLRALREKVGAVTIQKPGEGLTQWSIFQSLAPWLNVSTNYAAESRIKAAVKQRDSNLFKRLEWDTEAENVGIYADSESDIRAVASIINEILPNSAA